jgi:hypothetical protein
VSLAFSAVAFVPDVAGILTVVGVPAIDCILAVASFSWVLAACGAVIRAIPRGPNLGKGSEWWARVSLDSVNKAGGCRQRWASTLANRSNARHRSHICP